MKYINTFDTIAAYNTGKASLSTPNISLVQNNILHYKPLWNANPGDVVMYNDETGEFEYCTSGGYAESYFSKYNLHPIGVVACPGKYSPDGTTRVMSAKNMDAKHPTVGSVAHVDTGGVQGENSMIWGVTTTTGNTFLPNIRKVNPDTGASTNETAGWTWIPSDYPLRGTGAGWQNPEGLYSYYTSDSTEHTANSGPNPILANGSLNPSFYETGMATNDFDGKGNTDRICAVGYTGWESATEYSMDANTAGNFPAAFCCRRFSTAGTSAGKWYLPAAGELAFIVRFFGAINKGLKAIQDKRGEGVCMGTVNSEYPYGTYGTWCWSSSEYSSGIARNVDTYSGYVRDTTKSNTNTNSRVRAFIAL